MPRGLDKLGFIVLSKIKQRKKLRGRLSRFCHKHQSTLVVINSEAENKFIYDTFVSKPKFQKHYIGVKRIAKGCETFVTSEGKLLTYTNWDTGEPK